MTYLQIRQRIENLIHDSTSTTDAILKDHVNFAYQEILGIGDFVWLQKQATFSTVASTMSYTLNADVTHIFSVRQTTSPTKLTRVSKRDFDDLVPNPTASGNPLFYIEYDPAAANTPNIDLYPIPGSVLTMTYNYYKTVGDLSADTDTPVLPAKWHHLLVLGGLAYAYLYQNDQQAYGSFKQQFFDGVARMVKEDRKQPDYVPIMKSRDLQLRRFLRFPASYPQV